MHRIPRTISSPLLLAAALAAAAPAPALAQSLPLLSSVSVLLRHADALPEARRPAAAGLLVPVEGVTPDQLRDSYQEGRSGGRLHQAIDIHAPRGTPVVAVADGRIVKLHSGDRGGHSIYHLDEDGRTRYYYAHLDAYADGLREGQRVRQGDVIGYVGDTGNATPGDYHLHFSIAELRDTRRWWEGRNLNPFEYLRTGRRPQH